METQAENNKWKYMNPTPLFKPGDRVKITSPSKGATGAFMGWMGTVQKHPHHEGARHEVYTYKDGTPSDTVFGGTYGVLLDGRDKPMSFMEMELETI